MKAKTLLAAGLAGLMLLPAVPAFAAEEETAVTETSASGLEAAKKKVEAAQKVIEKGSLGFFEYVRDKGDEHESDAKAALAVFGDGILDEWTNVGDPADATSLENMKATLIFLSRGNELRAKHGSPALKVRLYLMAVEQKQLNWSDTNMTHSLAYGSMMSSLGWLGDNLAWGHSDPYEGWYTQEKVEYEKYRNLGYTEDAMQADNTIWYQVGHYVTLLDERNKSTGFAHNYVADGQLFSRVDEGYSVAEFTSLFNEYYNKVQKDLNEAKNLLLQYGIKMHRLYNPNSGEHFYTGDDKEAKSLVSLGWKDEGYGWTAPKESSVPVYRLYNGNAGDHHYTMSRSERNALVKAGWKDEGIGWYSDEDKTVPLYRQYNPQAKAGSHNYTTDENEAFQLVFYGWKDEGTAWYGM